MQTFQVYSLFDKKGGFYAPPVFVASSGIAIRGLQDLLKDKRSQVAAYPSDFELFHLGEYTDKDGMLKPFPKPVFVLNAGELVVPVPSNGGLPPIALAEKEVK